VHVTSKSTLWENAVYTLSHPRMVVATLPGSGDSMSGSLFCEKGSRHLVLWSLENLTGLSEILRQGTGCVKERY